MKFVCERCHTKYSIADEKVRGKVLKVRCKTCTNVITVRETGASIDDPANAGPREASVSQSGGFDAGAPTVANASPALLKAVRGAKTLPVDALFAPGVPVAAPPPRRPTPPPAAPLDDVEWYLAIDGAQTGPFSRARLIDKVMAATKGADVHVWNASFGEVWKAPKDVPEVDAELARRRRAAPSTPPPPTRRTGAMPLAAAGLSAQAHAHVDTGPGAAAHAGAVGAVHAVVDSGGHAGKSSGHQAPGQKKNGVGAATASAATSAALADDAANFNLGDLLGDVDTGLTPPPAVAAAVLAKGAGGHEAATVLTPPSAAGKTGAIPVTGVGGLGAKAKQIKLLLGAAAVVAVVCGIVLFWLFRKPTTSVAAAPPVTKPNATDFAGLAEKLAKEEAEKTPVPPPVETPPPPAAVDIKPIAKVEPPAKGQKNKKGRRAVAPPPLAPTSPPALTADQRAAANRFGDSTAREVRVQTTGTNAAAHSTPAQGDISRVINNNRQGIQTCYQRALLRDNSLTNGKITVRVNIGLSGRVKSVSLDAPAQFRTLEPCIREVMSRWAFPPSSEEYGTEFPVVLQGNQ